MNGIGLIFRGVGGMASTRFESLNWWNKGIQPVRIFAMKIAIEMTNNLPHFFRLISKESIRIDKTSHIYIVIAAANVHY